MNDETRDLGDREKTLEQELEQVQRELHDLFPPNTQPLNIGNPRQPKPLRRDERVRLHQRREVLRAELDELREGRLLGEE